ncbi:MAG: hypothetical protein HOP02_15565 [Methylococcaceae bacterium]|nr:hypothetical protein [Methylococcaceae bacterium]
MRCHLTVVGAAQENVHTGGNNMQVAALLLVNRILSRLLLNGCITNYLKEKNS